MYKLPAEPHSSFTSRHACERSRWIAVLASGITTCVTACALLISQSLIASTHVQAFSKQSQQAGADVFKAKGCEHCHGVDGIGTDRGPALTGIGKRWKKDRIEQQIYDGGGGMPPFGDAVQPDEMKLLVDYLAAKRKPSHVPTPPVTAPAAAKPSSDDGGI